MRDLTFLGSAGMVCLTELALNVANFINKVKRFVVESYNILYVVLEIIWFLVFWGLSIIEYL